MDILCSFRLVLEEKTGKEIPESSRFEFLEKFLANNFTLSDAEDNTSGPLIRGGTADLPLLRTLLAIHQKYPSLKVKSKVKVKGKSTLFEKIAKDHK